jgi:hypothetical protein
MYITTVVFVCIWYTKVAISHAFLKDCSSLEGDGNHLQLHELMSIVQQYCLYLDSLSYALNACAVVAL